jgi:Alpha-glutamyl/putrescinyl thymine pyrophosphorylase clade 2
MNTLSAPMSIEAFGAALLKTGDLDPMYLAVNNANLDYKVKHRLMMSYFCFYHLGAAAKMAEAATDKKFWALMMEAAEYSPVKMPSAMSWPRGSERRHYRGEQAFKSMFELVERYGQQPVVSALQHFIDGPGKGSAHMTFSSVSRNVQKHRGFGEWIAFKVADVAERVLGYDVDFSDCHLGIYKDPRQGAAVAYYGYRPGHDVGIIGSYNDHPWDYPISDLQLMETVQRYVKHFSKVKAKGLSRKVNVQEVETIFCKYKSHLKGHYPLGKDSEEIRHGLVGWGDLADQLRAGIPDAKWTQVVMDLRP